MDKSIELFAKNHSFVTLTEETEHYNIDKPWADSSFMLRFSKDYDFKPLEDIEMPTELCGIFHKTTQKLELFYAPLSDKMHFLPRQTTFYYKGVEFKTEFTTPSDTLVLLAKGFKEVEASSESDYRNLRIFRDYFREDTQTPYMKKFFADKKPYCFFISGDFKKIKGDFVPFCKHLNVYLKYFDRKSPTIAIINTEPKTEDYKLPCKTNQHSFPEQVSVTNLDQVALDLLHVANETGNSRLRYLFYYQVLEYFAYYYLDEELKRKLSNILKSPDILHNYNNFSRIIIEELKDYSNNTSDKQKLTKLIADYITVEDIHNEISCNMKYFLNDIEFDGNFKLPALITDEKIFDKIFSEAKETKEKKKEKEKLRADLLTALADRIDKIRNVLVHIRESRENKVILPTKTNNRKLGPYLFIVRRLAETISMKYNG